MRAWSAFVLVVVVAACHPPGYGKDKGPDIDAGSGSGSDPVNETDGGVGVDAPPIAKTCHHELRLDQHGTASSVLLTGDFVQWAPDPSGGAVPFVLGADGGWTGSYDFAQGVWQYKFVVDGNYIADPTNTNTVDDGFGGVNSVFDCEP